MIGYRAWRIGSSRHPLQLESLYVDYAWSRGLNVAVCQSDYPGTLHAVDAPIPDPDCWCGIWTLPSYEHVAEYLDKQPPSARCMDRGGSDLFWGVPLESQCVIGTIQTYGTHVEHENGIRCEKASINSLFVCPVRERPRGYVAEGDHAQSRPDIVELSTLYDLDVHRHRMTYEMARYYDVPVEEYPR